MTHVEILYDNNLAIGFKMSGHAGYNTKGPDILCASLSTASQMTVNGILDWVGLDIEEVVKESDPKEGILNVELSDEFYESITVQQLFKSFEMFIEQLSIQYNEYVKLERRQKDDN